MDLLGKEVANLLKSILDEQLENERNGKYVEAEQCRLKLEKQKMNEERKVVHKMEQKHKQEQDELTKVYNDELAQFNQYWDNKMSDFNQKSNQTVKQLSAKHQNELHVTREELQKQLPLKLKESSQLLNLRKMQEHLVKQKNYPQAKKVQKQASKMFETENKEWIIKRNTKIQTTLNTIKNRQNTEMKNLQKRISSTNDEQVKDRQLTELKMKQRFDNNMKDVKAAQEREILKFKGEFRNLGGANSPHKPKGHPLQK